MRCCITRCQNFSTIVGAIGFLRLYSEIFIYHVCVSPCLPTGDADYKPYISGVPDLECVPLDGTEDYMVLACDGLWDTVTPNDLVKDVYDYLKENSNDRAGLAHKLTMIARERGSTDNISVIIVFFRDDIGTPKPLVKYAEILESEAADKDEGDEDDGDDDGGEEEKKDSPENSEKSDKSQRPGGSSGGGGGDNGGQSPGPDSSSSNDKGSPDKSPNSYMSHEDSMEVSSNSNGLTPKGYSPRSGQQRQTKSDIVLTQQNLYLSDAPSEASSSDIKLLAQTATKCINNRRGKRSKAGRRRAMKDVRRSSKESVALSGVAHRTNSTPTKGTGSMGSGIDCKARSSSIWHSHLGITKTGDNLLEMLTGCSAHTLSKARQGGKWTVAREIESDSAMFNE